ncbi:MAG TPA: flagellar hook-basal body protein [Clostridia bacterium]|nr:flagellar hook-basal body protein [Clostridia bacterium]
MIRGIYSAASGMMLERDRLDVAANNLANASTSGFKKDVPVVETPLPVRMYRVRDPVPVLPLGAVLGGASGVVTWRREDQNAGGFSRMLREALFSGAGAAGISSVSGVSGIFEIPELPCISWAANSPVPIGRLQMGSTVGSIHVIHTQGPLIETREPLNVALKGPGFFEVLTPAGLRYTRQGVFTLLPDGTLATIDGHVVMGDAGPLTIRQGQRTQVGNAGGTESTGIVISSDGTVSVGGIEVGRLRVVQFDDTSLMLKEGNSLFAPGGATEIPAALGRSEAGGTEVIQGFIEGSNVNPVEEMVEMITIMRAYEMGQKVIQAHDETLGKAVNDVGRV